MTVSDLFRVSTERQWVKIIHEGFTIYSGRFENVPDCLLDCTIKNLKPSYYNVMFSFFVIVLND